MRANVPACDWQALNPASLSPTSSERQRTLERSTAPHGRMPWRQSGGAKWRVWQQHLGVVIQMEFRKVLALRGPNLWSNSPVLEAWVDLQELKDSPSDELPGLSDRLM